MTKPCLNRVVKEPGMKSYTAPIIVVEYDDGSTESRKMSSLGAARALCAELKSDLTVLAVTIHDANKIDRSWSRRDDRAKRIVSALVKDLTERNRGLELAWFGSDTDAIEAAWEKIVAELLSD